MTYFGFLLRFLVIPLLVFLAITIWDARRGRQMTDLGNGRAVWLGIFVHVLLAVVYTTPWDNYLVATGVWYYNPQLVTGLLLGYVPVEEYTFFVLQTIFTGLWWWFLARRLAEPADFRPARRFRFTAVVFLGLLWLVSLAFFVSGWPPATYLSITLAWALPPIGLQLLFGADILWHYRRLVALTILPVTLYLAVTDSLAIAAGTWTIAPQQSTGIFLGALPLEEAIFFLVTNVLIGFGLTLLLSNISRERLVTWKTGKFKGLPKKTGSVTQAR